MVDIDFSDIQEKYTINVPETFDNVVVVDNLPIVDSSKESKLIAVVKKIFKNIGVIEDNGIYMPKGDDEKSKGFMFIHFANADEAKLAIAQADGYKLDKSHSLAVSAFDEIEKYATLDDKYQAPEIEEFVPKEHLKFWLADSKARDQFAILRGDEVTVYWNNKAELPDKIQTRQSWTDLFLAWSPLGSYFVTTHKQGIALWGGPSWKKINRFAHPNVTMLDFSPNEKYVVTWSKDSFKTLEGQMHNLCVWEVATGTLLRSFPSPDMDKKTASDWPLLKWSHDDTYVARMSSGAQGSIYVYEAQSMGLLDKKSIKVENLVDFYWSPSENIISYWTPELGNIPARVTLMNIPSRTIVRTKNFFNVLECKLFWQPAGDYLLVRVDRSKTKTTTITSFEVFRMREKDIPIDVVELKVSEEMTSLFWEPKGNRFALMVTENNTPFMYFYEVQTFNPATAASAAVKVLKHFECKGINQVFWSPKGRFCVLAGIRGVSSSGDLQFWDVEELLMFSAGEHYLCTDVEWDPTGRYVVTSVSNWKVQNDTGLVLWTMTGQELVKQTIAGFKQFLWRPRPKTLLSAAEQKKVKKNLKEYSKQFDEEDYMEANKASAEIILKRREQWAEYKKLMAKYQDQIMKEKDVRVALYGFDPAEHGKGVIIEEVVEVVEQIA